MMEDRLIIVGIVFGWLFVALLVGWVASAIESADYDNRKDGDK